MSRYMLIIVSTDGVNSPFFVLAHHIVVQVPPNVQRGDAVGVALVTARNDKIQISLGITTAAQGRGT